MPKFASWDENLGSHTPDVQAAARALERVIREALPDVVVQYDPGNGLLAFGRSMRMRDLLFALIPHAAWVNLQLADGALLPNPDGLIEGTGKKIRHIKVRSAEAAADPRVGVAIRGQIHRERSGSDLVRAGMLGLVLLGLLEARAVPRGLGLVAAGAHVAPAAPAGRGGVEECPAAAIVRAHAKAFRSPGRELLDDRLGDQRERVVDRPVGMAVADTEGGAVELEAGRAAQLEGRVDEVDGVGLGLAALDHGIDDLAQGASHAADTGEVRLEDGNAGVGMHELVLEEPHRGVRGRLEVLVAEVLLVRPAVPGMQRVQEVEGGLQVDAVGVLGGGDVSHQVSVRFPCR